MRVYDNGVYRDATPREIAAWQQAAAEAPAPEPTTEDRLAALEEKLTATNILLGLED